MTLFRRLFTDHPQSVGESYFEHMSTALKFAWVMARASAAIFLHAFLPGLFVKTGSHAISTLYARMVANRNKSGARGLTYLDFVI